MKHSFLSSWSCPQGNPLEECRLGRVTFDGHVVVCGAVEGLFHLIAPLRRKTLDKLRPIVIMDDVLPLREQASLSFCSVPSRPSRPPLSAARSL